VKIMAKRNSTASPQAAISLGRDLGFIDNSPTTAATSPLEVFDAVYERLMRAQALSELLYEMAAPGGDLEAGERSMQQLDHKTLHTNLSTLNGMLIDALHLLVEKDLTLPLEKRDEVAHA
jgi:hypothetical protein